ncbi:hypothetical protein [Streptomyces regalis]|uniref:hypothetical protein n=1 Tax=Streptomyces regalis TaxID=68262 RepID=UPI000A6CFB55|nr:hypothetical protein [Streptomyces regalis]
MTDATTGRGMEQEPARSGPTAAPTGGTEHGGTESGHEATVLFPHDESDTFELQLQHAVSGFVDGPRSGVEEADHVLEELTGRLTEPAERLLHV